MATPSKKYLESRNEILEKEILNLEKNILQALENNIDKHKNKKL